MIDMPEMVQRVIAAHIESVTDIEILVLLGRNPLRRWSTAAVSFALMIDPAIAADSLERLNACGLLARKETGDDVVYTCNPSAPDICSVVDWLVVLYPAYRVRIIDLISSRPLA